MSKSPWAMGLSDSIEVLLDEIGFGRWQWLLLVTVFVSQIVGPVQQLGSPLLSGPVPFRCSLQNNNQALNSTIYDVIDEDKPSYPSLCLDENSNRNATFLQQASNSVIKTSIQVTGLPSCPVIEYDSSIFQSTVITEWHLVCESLALRPLYQMSYPVGSIIGSVFCGQLSDWLGRKKGLQIGCLLTITSIMIISVVPWYSVMIFIRILSGIGSVLMIFPGYTLLSEVSPANRRTLTNMIPGLTFFMGMTAFAGVAYLKPNWRQLILLCNMPLLLMLPLTFIIEESPRWLLQKGRTKEATCLLRKAAEKNCATLSSSTLTMLNKLEKIVQDDSATGRNESAILRGDDTVECNVSSDFFSLLRACFTSPGMRIILIVTPLLWVCQRALYVGLAINANNFTSSNPFEYVAFSGAMGVAGMILSLPLSIKLPRKIFLTASLFAGGILIFLEMAVPSEYWWIKWTMVLTAFCLACGAFQINYIYALELYPTEIRTRGFTLNNFVGAIGELTMPLVTEIGVQYKWWAASVTFGTAGLVGSLLLFFLPETKDLAMPDTLQDVEDRYHKQWKKQESPLLTSNIIKKEKVKEEYVKQNQFGEPV